jgi:hypothetical protein
VGENRWGHCFHVQTRSEAKGLRALLNELQAKASAIADLHIPRRVLEALEAAAEALGDLGACDDPDCRDENCNHALTQVRNVLAEQ